MKHSSRGNIPQFAVPFIVSTISLLLVCFAFFSNSANAAIPSTMNFQGRLTDSTGTIMPDGLYNMQFKLYDASSAGTLLWSETRQMNGSDYRVQVTNGLFSTQLGQQTALPASIFTNTNIYFEITMANPATATCNTTSCQTWESPMTARQKLATSAYAFNSDTLDGLDSTAFAAATGSANYIQNGSSPQTANFNVTGTGTAALLQAATFDRASAGTLTIGGTNATSITMADSATLSAGLSLTLTGGNTASRPGSPVEGMVYYDTDTKQLLTYANGKWQADRSDAVLVAASNSSAADKAAADYVADGNTAAANDGDQVQINNALTAGSGKKVVLLAGTYTLDAAVSVPNNTTLAGVGDGSLITVPNSFNASIGIITNTDSATGTGVTVRDLKIDGNKANQTSGTMRGVYFNNMGAGSGASARPGGIVTGVLVQNVYGGNGVLLENTHNTVLTATVARLNSASGINIDTSNNNRITANQSQGNGSLGINLATASNNTITGNMVDGNTATGISMGASSDENTVSGNTVFDNASHGISSAGSNTTVTGNTVGNNTGTGIFFSAASGGTITSNVITASGNRGINISSSSNVVISSNQISGSVSSGMYLSGSTTLTINANRVHDNSGAANNNGIFLTSTDGTSIYDNLITDTACGAGNTCSAININDSTSDNTYLSGNTFTGDGVDAAIINDVGTGTIYAGQSMTQGGLNIRFRQANSTTAFNIQNANGISVLNVDTTNGELEVGNYNGGTNPVNGKIVFGNSTNANLATIQSGATSASYSLTLPTALGSTGQCLSDTTGAGVLGWATCVDANLSNLGTTSIAVDLLPESTDAYNLGASNDFWHNGYFGGSLFSPALRPVIDGTTALLIQNTAGTTTLMTFDTSGNAIQIGSSTTDATAIELTLDSYNGTSDPTATNGSMYYNTSSNRMRCAEGSTATWRNCTGLSPMNNSTATQAMTAGTDVYLNGSVIPLPIGGFKGPTVSGSQNGTLVTWTVTMSKTAAGTAASSFNIRVGTNGTTADTARCTAFSTGTATAASDWATVTITALVTAGGSSTTLNCSGMLRHNLTTTGFSNAIGVTAYSTAASFDSTAAGTKIGLSLNAGASSVITVQQVQAVAINL